MDTQITGYSRKFAVSWLLVMLPVKASTRCTKMFKVPCSYFNLKMSELTKLKSTQLLIVFFRLEHTCKGRFTPRGQAHFCVRGLKSSLAIDQKAQIGPNPFTPRGRANLVVWFFLI